MLKFGVNMVVPDSRAAWVEKCRKAEALGFDVVGAADHLGMAPPFPALVLAAEVTERVRLNTFVINTAFYNPVLLARDVTGTDQFTEGRLELGLGAGYRKAEFEAAGMEFPRAGLRVEHLEHTIKELKRLYADEGHKPETVQKPGPPLMIAGRGDRVLALAAEHADIIGFSGTAAVPDGGALVLDDAAGIDGRVAFVREKLRGRAAEFNVISQVVTVTRDRRAGLESAHEFLKGTLTVEQLAEVPTVLIGTHEQIAEQILAHRERFGLTYFTVLERNMEPLAPVIDLVRGK
ncbi:TIGR03621 family F420-dependent LLM class oxidoreductase [Amycolatopsis umgeniensis]|uniref:Putative F420-dependent oxidoreductase n=1 Tax=Amycolatopsis umgeniensis TaxID=336628 RepID=A0A841B4K4_9PSEU|nr:TIGR03621 family F420-dependent LLM class oxidoreductase [Amycolatopsis umgeniensis]MBB5853913.1 putative F420-dependent oxidoreductase [Amycolatopsis umgeniensis]